MTDTAAPIQTSPASRNRNAIVLLAGFLLLALLGYGTWKALHQNPSVIKLDIQPVPPPYIGTGRYSITHGINSSDWIVHSANTAAVNMVIHRDEFLGSYSYKFQTTRAGAGGRGGNRFGGGFGARGGTAQTSPAVTNILNHADLLKLTADQVAAISAIEPADLPVAQLDPADQQAAIQHWLDLVAAPDETGKAAAETKILANLTSISTKLEPYTQLPNALLDSFLNPSHPGGILTPDQMAIYRTLERQAATQPANNLANARGNTAAAPTTNTGRATAAANPAGARGTAATTRPANRVNATPITPNRAGAPATTTPPNSNSTTISPRPAATTPPAPTAATPAPSTPPAPLTLPAPSPTPAPVSIPLPVGPATNP
jgi:hypothetical protein